MCSEQLFVALPRAPVEAPAPSKRLAIRQFIDQAPITAAHSGCCSRLETSSTLLARAFSLRASRRPRAMARTRRLLCQREQPEHACSVVLLVARRLHEQRMARGGPPGFALGALLERQPAHEVAKGATTVSAMTVEARAAGAAAGLRATRFLELARRMR